MEQQEHPIIGTKMRLLDLFRLQDPGTLKVCRNVVASAEVTVVFAGVNTCQTGKSLVHIFLWGNGAPSWIYEATTP